jgi:hypothetical protein
MSVDISTHKAGYMLKSNDIDEYTRDDLWDSIKTASFSQILKVIAKFPEIEETLKDYLIESYDLDAATFIDRVQKITDINDIDQASEGALYNSIAQSINDLSDKDVIELCRENGIELTEEYDMREDLAHELYKIASKPTEKPVSLEEELKNYGIAPYKMYGKSKEQLQKMLEERKSLYETKLLTGSGKKKHRIKK